jgi:hypothetical protein
MGNLFKIPAMIIYLIGGLWSLFICLGIVHDKLGFIGTFISLFLLPITLYLSPWYVAFVDGNWQPVIVVYGTSAIAFALFFIGSMIDKD